MSLDLFTALGTLAQAGAQIGTGVAANSAAKKQARRAKIMAGQAAEDERRKGRRLAGSQRAGFAKGGVRIDEGTPLDVLAQTAANAELNALRAAFAFEQQADDFKRAGTTALVSGILGAGTTILGKAETFRDVINSLQDESASASGPAIPASARGGSMIPSYRIPPA